MLIYSQTLEINLKLLVSLACFAEKRTHSTFAGSNTKQIILTSINDFYRQQIRSSISTRLRTVHSIHLAKVTLAIYLLFIFFKQLREKQNKCVNRLGKRENESMINTIIMWRYFRVFLLFRTHYTCAIIDSYRQTHAHSHIC